MKTVSFSKVSPECFGNIENIASMHKGLGRIVFNVVKKLKSNNKLNNQECILFYDIFQIGCCLSCSIKESMKDF